MFKKVTITLNEAVGISRIFHKILGGFDIINFTFAHRLKRQIKKLEVAEQAFSEAQKSVIVSIIGEEGLEAADGEPLDDVLGKDQLMQFNELFGKELESDFDAELLSESFEEFLEGVELPAETAELLIAALDFLEEKSFGE